MANVQHGDSIPSAAETIIGTGVSTRKESVGGPEVPRIRFPANPRRNKKCESEKLSNPWTILYCTATAQNYYNICQRRPVTHYDQEFQFTRTCITSAPPGVECRVPSGEPAASRASMSGGGCHASTRHRVTAGFLDLSFNFSDVTSE